MVTAMRKRRLCGGFQSQRVVAEILGFTQSAVNKWELGLAKPRADKLLALAKLYGCTIEELLTEEVPKE